MRFLYRKKIIILAYHGFTDKKSHEGIEDNEGMHLNVEKFRLQVEYLKKYYNVISLNQLIQHYISSTKIPNNAVIITIDDGYKSIYTYAYPILRYFDIPATIFLTTDFIDKKELLWPDRIEYAINMTKSPDFKLVINKDIISFDLRDNDSKRLCCRKICHRLKLIPQELRRGIIENLEYTLKQKLSIDRDTSQIYSPLEWHDILEMVKSGIISIGSHTCSHIILTRCNPENTSKELSLSRQLIEKRTGLTCTLFSYPSGTVEDFDRCTKEALIKLGYSCGLTTIQGMNNGHSDLFELKRLGIDAGGGLILFIMMLSGVVKFLIDIKRSITNFLKGKVIS